MKFLKFMFTARMSFVLFALLAFALTVLYVAWVHHTETPTIRPHPATQTR
jgi:membrane protein implicated in regulation of membrane protease activity